MPEVNASTRMDRPTDNKGQTQARTGLIYETPECAVVIVTSQDPREVPQHSEGSRQHVTVLRNSIWQICEDNGSPPTLQRVESRSNARDRGQKVLGHRGKR
jgi:hypothetical protein